MKQPEAALQLALLFAVMGAVTIGVTWYGSGDEPTAATQLPYVVVALGVGLGSLLAAGLLYATARLRRVQLRVERTLLRSVPKKGPS